MTWGTHCPQCGREDCNWIKGKNCEGSLRAENERLRAALLKIANTQVPIMQVVPFARRTLDGEKG